MSESFGSNIGVFYEPDGKEGSFGDSITTATNILKNNGNLLLDATTKSAGEVVSSATNTVGAYIGKIESQLIAAEDWSDIDKILKEKSDLTIKQKETILALYEIGEIGNNEVGANPLRGSDKITAIENALKMSTNEPHIIVFSKGKKDTDGKYEIYSINQYKASMEGNANNINATLLHGILHNAVKHRDGKIYEKYFTKDTLTNLAFYLEGCNFKSKLVPDGINLRPLMESLIQNKKAKEQSKFEGTLNFVYNKYGKSETVQNYFQAVIKDMGSYKIDKLQKESGIEFFKNGELNIDEINRAIVGNLHAGDTETDIQTATNSVTKTIQEITQKLSEGGDKLLSELGKNTKLSAIPELQKIDFKKPGTKAGDPDIKTAELSTINDADIPFVIETIENIPKDQTSESVARILLYLSTRKSIQGMKLAKQTVEELEQRAKKNAKENRGYDVNHKELTKEEKEDIKKQNKINEKFIGATMTLINIEKLEKELFPEGINNNQIDLLINKLEEIKNPTDLDLNRINLLKSKRQQNVNIAQAYVQARNEFGAEEAARMMNQSNSIVDPTRRPYNKEDLKKFQEIEFKNNPEKKDINDSLEKMPIGEITTIGNTSLLKNANDSYYIVGEDNKPKIPEPIQTYQLESCEKQIKFIEDTGLRKLLPVLPDINTLLSSKLGYSINYKDGNMTDEELNKFLKITGKILMPESEIHGGDLNDRIKNYSREIQKPGVKNLEESTYYRMETAGILNTDGNINKSTLLSKIKNIDTSQMKLS